MIVQAITFLLISSNYQFPCQSLVQNSGKLSFFFLGPIFPKKKWNVKWVTNKIMNILGPRLYIKVVFWMINITNISGANLLRSVLFVVPLRPAM